MFNNIETYIFSSYLKSSRGILDFNMIGITDRIMYIIMQIFSIQPSITYMVLLLRDKTKIKMLVLENDCDDYGWLFLKLIHLVAI